ncbi:MAG: GNAT family N-acetyltransferase [Nocardioidaceae bacterium]
MVDHALLNRLETYYDAVPRGRADPEDIGPFTLFVARTGWPYYARPRLDGVASASAADVRLVLERQRELKVPQSFEWVVETTPGLEAVAVEAGLTVERCPLLVLDGDPRGDAGTARMLGPGEVRDLALSRAAISVGFGASGTAGGAEGVAERDAALGEGFAVVDETAVKRLAERAIRAAACYAVEQPDLGPVGGGSHSPVGEVTEIAGVGVLPAFRRRGLAAAVTYVLARDALDGGVTTVFCSAQSRDVSRIYERVGFRVVATACIASLPGAGGDSAG